MKRSQRSLPGVKLVRLEELVWYDAKRIYSDRSRRQRPQSRLLAQQKVANRPVKSGQGTDRSRSRTSGAPSSAGTRWCASSPIRASPGMVRPSPPSRISSRWCSSIRTIFWAKTRPTSQRGDAEDPPDGRVQALGLGGERHRDRPVGYRRAGGRSAGIQAAGREDPRPRAHLQRRRALPHDRPNAAGLRREHGRR